MPKSQNSPRPKRTLILVSCTVIVLLASAVIITVLLLGARTQAPAGNVQTTLTGEFVCLPHKDTSGAQTLECAFGLLTNDNRYYALQFVAHPNDIQMNKRVEVAGTLTTGIDSNYNVVGSIKVESFHY